MQDLELVIFDLAGTTVEDHGEVPGAFTAALDEYDIKVTPEQINAVRGSSKRQALLHLIPEGPAQRRLAEEIYASFRGHLTQRYASQGVRPVPGAALTFRLLREHHVRVALDTGFDRETTGVLLEALGWNEGIVDAVVCGDDVASGAPGAVHDLPRDGAYWSKHRAQGSECW